MAKFVCVSWRPSGRAAGAGRCRSLPGLLLASLLVGLPSSLRAEGVPDATRRGGARSIADWRVTLPDGPGPGAAAVLRGRLLGSSARPALLAVRCIGQQKLAVEAVIAEPRRGAVGYRLENGRIGREPPHGPKRLAGGRMLREIPHGDLLTIDIDDAELGLARLRFRLAGARDALRQVANACAGRADASRAASGVSGAARARATKGKQLVHQRPVAPAPDAAPLRPGRSAHEARDKAAVPEADQPTAALSRDSEARDSSSPPPWAPAPSPDVERTPAPPGESAPVDAPDYRAAAPATPEAPAAPGSQGSPPAPAKSPGGPPAARPDDRGASPSTPETASTASPKVAEAVPSPPPRPTAPAPIDPGKHRERLAAFVQTYGPNRKGELIYDWYRQCLHLAGVPGDRVWYLSGEQLTYLSKGETDEVRLSLLVSTDPDLAVPPRRISCYGTAQGRNLRLIRAEKP